MTYVQISIDLMVFILVIKKLGPDAGTFTNDLDFQHRFSKFTCIRKSVKNKRIQQIREILPDITDVPDIHCISGVKES